jgi:hypothetical protein
MQFDFGLGLGPLESDEYFDSLKQKGTLEGALVTV